MAIYEFEGELPRHPAVTEFSDVLSARNQDQALEALERWRHLPEWPHYWISNGGLTCDSTCLFEDACCRWPWLALRMLDAGLSVKDSENGGCVALYTACAAIPDMEVRVDLVKRILSEGVDVNGLGPTGREILGRTPLAGVIHGYGLKEAQPILEVLLEAPGIRLYIQRWKWDTEFGVPEPADSYAQIVNRGWAIPRLKEAIAHKAHMEAGEEREEFIARAKAKAMDREEFIARAEVGVGAVASLREEQMARTKAEAEARVARTKAEAAARVAIAILREEQMARTNAEAAARAARARAILREEEMAILREEEMARSRKEARARANAEAMARARAEFIAMERKELKKLARPGAEAPDSVPVPSPSH